PRPDAFLGLIPSSISCRLALGMRRLEGVRRGAAVGTACAVVGGGLLVAIVLSEGRPRQDAASVRLALISASNSESEHTVSSAVAQALPSRNDYRPVTRATV